MQVTIKTDTPNGRKLMKEIVKNPQSVESLMPAPSNEKTYSVDEVYHYGMKKLSEYYNVDMYEIAKNAK
ncbi:MAG: hypothetical protein Q4G48_04415 [Bacteroidia bacterium]|nr:hypothetical protein [Bacteroidia bacterium]